MTGLYHLEIPKTAGGIGHLEFSSGIAFEVCLTLCGTVYFGDSAADDMSLFKVNNIHYPPPTIDRRIFKKPHMPIKFLSVQKEEKSRGGWLVLAMCRLQYDGELPLIFPPGEGLRDRAGSLVSVKGEFFQAKASHLRAGLFLSLTESSCVGKPRKPHLKGCTWTK